MIAPGFILFRYSTKSPQLNRSNYEKGKEKILGSVLVVLLWRFGTRVWPGAGTALVNERWRASFCRGQSIECLLPGWRKRHHGHWRRRAGTNKPFKQLSRHRKP